MIKLPDGLFVDALGYSKAERLGEGISTSDKIKLIAELEEAGLASAPLAARLDYLNTPKEYTQTPDTMYGTPSQMAALAGLVQDRMMALPLDSPKRAAAKELSELAFQRSQLITNEGRNANRDAPSTQGLKAKAMALELLTEAEFNAHFTEYPDGFQPVISETPASHVIGARVIVESEDLT